MTKAYVFPGQGAQFSGMGKHTYEQTLKARNLMETANDILGFRLTDVMFSGSDEELRQTHITQPAIFVHSYVKCVCLPDFDPKMVAGHSLGEFSALAAAGSITFEDALKLVCLRAEKMQHCCEEVPGTMAAVIGMDDDAVIKICAETEGLVVAANFNAPGQVVISGETDAVNRAAKAASDAGARRVLPLSVGGAFHTKLMKPAADDLAKAISDTKFSAPICPVYQNVSAKAETDSTVIKENLLRQLTSPVLWTQSIRAMIDDGADTFTELGPGSVLTGLIKRIASACGKNIVLL